MATPKSPQPDRKPSSPASPPPPAAQDTKRPTDSVPMQTGTFANLPMRFGRYQVEKLLGRGAMGAVYLARDMQLERLVALKIPKLSGSGAAKLLQRLKTEARAAAQIDHPSVCPVYDTGEIEGTSFIAMQYIEGETLKEQLQKQAKSPQEAVELVIHLAEGLAEAHSKNIYHRDLKPENIKVNRRGVPVIMDFGLAKLAATVSTDAGKTQSGTILGSPAYMSPEQATGKVDEVDHRSDLYSLGVMLFELLTGQWPFTGASLQVMGQKSILDPPSPLTIKADLDPQLAAVCLKMIARERAHRYQTAQEVITALKAIRFGAKPAAGGPATPGPAAGRVEIPAFEQAGDALASIIARKRQKAATSTTPVKRLQTLFGSLVQSVRSAARSEAKGQPQTKQAGTQRIIWIGSAVGVLVAAVLVLWAGGVFKVKTKDGILVIDVNEPGAEVFVDGEQATVTWGAGEKGGQQATVHVQPGEHAIKVTRSGFSVEGKKLTFKEGVTEIFTAKLRPVPAAANASIEGQEAGQERDDNGLKMELVWCPPGEFLMGSPPSDSDAEEDEKPQVQVTLSQGFWLGKYEVTQGQWRQLMGTQPWKGQQNVREGDDFPASYVSWTDAVGFCEELTLQERSKVRVPAGWEFSLPSEGQWEYACRAGTTTRFNFGDDAARLGDCAWWGGAVGSGTARNEQYPHRIGLKEPNLWGLHEMHGNLGEWCQDVQAKKLAGGTGAGETSGETLKMFRGGGWGNVASSCRSAFHDSRSAANRNNNVGFRVTLRRSGDIHATAGNPSKTNTTGKATLPKQSTAAAAAIAATAAPLAGANAGQERDDNSLKMKLVWCPPGRFLTGSPANDPDAEQSEKRRVEVTLSQGFWLGKYEVTQGLWQQLMGSQPWKGQKDVREGDDFPATCVSWTEAMNFCETLTLLERAKGLVASGSEFSLPSEAQWEYACRAGTATRYSFGDDPTQLGKYAWWGSQEDTGTAQFEQYAHAVGLKLPNPWGLHDIHGNASEWCQDWFQYEISGGSNPRGPATGTERVVRGGSWSSPASRCRSAHRFGSVPASTRMANIGFRVALIPSGDGRAVVSTPLTTSVPGAKSSPAAATPQNPAPAGSKPDPERGDDEKKLTASFFETKCIGKSFVYVVDCSGSMTGKRFERAKSELVRSINKLRGEQEFYIFFFNDRTFPLFDPKPAKGLVHANASNKQRAVRWISNRVAESTTNPDQSLQQALEMKPDVIFLMTDGELDNPEAVRRMIQKNNKSKVAIHTVALENNQGSGTLESIAKDNAGTFRYVK